MNEIKVNLIEEDLLRPYQNKTETKTEGNVEGLLMLTPEKSLFNGIEFIKK